MDKNQFDILCNDLALNFEQNLPARVLTDEPTEEIDTDAVLAEKRQCFVINKINRVPVKKSLVLSSWYIQHLDEETRADLMDFFDLLIRAGHKIYVSGLTDNDQTCLKLAESYEQLDRLVNKISPVNTDLAIKLAAEEKLSRQSIEIINTRRLLDIAGRLRELKRSDQNIYNSFPQVKVNDFYPLVPYEHSNNEVALFENLVDGQQDGFSLEFNPHISVHPFFADKIRSLAIKGRLSDADIDLICSKYQNLEHLIIDDSDISTEQLQRIINSNKKLSTLNISKCHQLIGDSFELNSEALLQLSKFTINECKPFSTTVLTAVLRRAIQLEQLILNEFTLESDKDFDLISGRLSKLKEVYFAKGDLSTNQMLSLVKTAPNISILNFLKSDSHFKHLDINTKLQKLTELRIDEQNFPYKLIRSFFKLSCLDINLGLGISYIVKRLLKSSEKEKEGYLKQTRKLFLPSIPLSDRELKIFLRIAPNVSLMNIEGNNVSYFRKDFAPDEKLSNLKFPQLTQLLHLNAKKTGLGSDQVVKIINNAPNLSILKVNTYIIMALQPNQLSNLTELELSGGMISPKELRTILLAAPNLTKLTLSGVFIQSEEKFDDLPFGCCASLRTLIVSDGYNNQSGGYNQKVIIPLEIINSIVSASSCLTHLDISGLGSTSSHTRSLNLHEKSLEHLRIFKCDRRWDVFSLEALQKASNLKDLSLYSCDAKQLKFMSGIRSLNVLRRGFSVENYPDLESLNIDLSGSGDLDYIAPNVLSKLKKLVIKGLSSRKELQMFLLASTNIHHLSIIEGQVDNEFSLNLQEMKLPFLSTMDIRHSNITQEDLVSIILAAPSLQNISLHNCININKQVLGRLQENFPGITFNRSETVIVARVYGAKESHPIINKNTIKPDGDLENDPSKEISYRRIFKENSRLQPDINTDHVDVFKYNANQRVYSKYIPQEANLEFYVPEFKSSDEIEQTFFIKKDAESLKDHLKKHFIAKKLIQLNTTHDWQLLPARSNNDKLLSFATDPQVDCEFRRDKETGYYYFRPKMVASGLILATYTIQTDVTTNWSDRSDPAGVKRALEAVRQLRFNDAEELDRNSKAYKSLMSEKPNVRAEALRTFCNFDKESAPKFIGTHAQLLNHLMEVRSGACRHRVDLFMVIANQIGLDAYRVENDVHTFPIIKNEAGDICTLDLGGAAANLVELPEAEKPLTPLYVREVKNDIKQEAEHSLKKNPGYKKPKSNNPYQTWKITPLKGKEASSLVNELLFRSERKTRQMLLTKDKQSIDELHKAVLQSKQKDQCFFTANLDSLSLDTAHVTDGQSSRVDTPVKKFLNHATANPEQTHTWFINWSDAKAEHISFNGIIDSKHPQLSGVAIPSNVKVVVVIDDYSAIKMGKDFYSRMQLRSEAPVLTRPKQPEPGYKEIDDENDVLFANIYDWKKELLGHHAFHQSNMEVVPGALLKAIERARAGKKLTLNIHNAPWENDDFRWFMDELLIKRKVFFNGEEKIIPDNLTIRFTLPIFNFPSFSDCLIDPVLVPKSDLSHQCVLNVQTWSSFFPGRYAGKYGIMPSKGLFEQLAGKRISLIVSDNLSDVQWYKLLKEARRHNVKLALETTPNASLPHPYLQGFVTKAAPMICTPPVKLVVSNDLDFVLKQEQTNLGRVHTVPVSKNTRFASLFSHTQRVKDAQGKMTFISTKTDLLRAIERGEPVVLKGHYSVEFAQKLQSLFVNPPFLLVNGERIEVKSPIIVLADNETPFKEIDYEQVNYSPERDLARLPLTLAERLRQAYSQLKLDPCYSHFRDVPREDFEEQSVRIDDLIKRLYLAAGQSEPGKSEQSALNKKATQAADILAYLKGKPFVFLSSESGAGKSHVLKYSVPEYGKSIGQSIKVYHGLADLKAWADSKNDVSILFIDEANISEEDYLQFDNLANGERVLWLNGVRYVLSPNHHVVFAGNPLNYGGRLQADLFKRHPNYMEFIGEPLSIILEPFAKSFVDEWPELLVLIEQWYQKALHMGLNITPRNAQMICQTALALNLSMPHMSNRVLVSYAILNELKTLSVNSLAAKPLRKELRKEELADARNALKKSLSDLLPELESKEFIWVD